MVVQVTTILAFILQDWRETFEGSWALESQNAKPTRDIELARR